MTRKKYNYEQLILMPQFRELQIVSINTMPDKDFAVYDKERRAFLQKNRAGFPKLVPWLHGPAMTNNADGSCTQVLKDWLTVNEQWIEIMGYAEVGEPVNVWNPQSESWEFDKHGEFKFSAAYWEYLLSEGYVKRWIECHESRLSSKFQSLSYSFPTEHIQKRIMGTEIPDPTTYDPLEGLMSECEIYRFQDAARVNSVRNKRLMVAESAK